MDNNGVDRRAFLRGLGVAAPIAVALPSIAVGDPRKEKRLTDSTESVGQLAFRNRKRLLLPSSGDDDDIWDPPAPGGFHSYESLSHDIDALSSATGLVRESLGKTFENREIFSFRVKVGGGAVKKRILLIGGHHACERISVEIAYLLGKYVGQEGARYSFLRDVEVTVIPMLNPDGHSYLSPDDLKYNWRKNRSLQGNQFGVDLNRNYPVAWGALPTSSPERGSIFYQGPYALSELETQALKNLFDRRAQARTQFDALISYHSYGEFVLYPWASETNTGKDPRIESLKKIAIEMAKASQDVGVAYQAIPASEFYSYPVGGELGDWAIQKYGIKSLAVELSPDRSANSPGNCLRASAIQTVFAGHLPAALKFLEWVGTT